MGIKRKIKFFVGNPKFISIPCMDILIDDEDVDVIYVTDDPWIVYRYEYLDKCPGGTHCIMHVDIKWI